MSKCWGIQIKPAQLERIAGGFHNTILKLAAGPEAREILEFWGFTIVDIATKSYLFVFKSVGFQTVLFHNPLSVVVPLFYFLFHLP